MTIDLRSPTRVPVRLTPGIVRLVDATPDELTSAFLNHDLERFEMDPDRVLDVPATDYVAAWRDAPDAPVGLVFHIGRCGSTLLARMLDHAPDLTCYKEPGILTQGHSMSRWSEADLEPRELHAASMKHLAANAAARGNRAVIKLTSWSGPHLVWALDQWPELAAVLLHRDPLESVASLVEQPARWSFDPIRRRGTLEESVPGVREMVGEPFTADAWAAAVWRHAVESLMTSHASRTLALDYRAVASPDSDALDQVASQFGLATGDWLEESRQVELPQYSKRGGDDDGPQQAATERSPLSDHAAARVLRITEPARRLLAAAADASDWA